MRYIWLGIILSLCFLGAGCGIQPSVPLMEEETPLPFAEAEAIYNGITVGVTTAKEVQELLGQADQTSSSNVEGANTISYTYGDVSYLTAEKANYRVQLISVMGENAPAFSRDIRCGDPLAEILEKFPAGYFTEPKKWYDEGYYPRAELIDGSQLLLQSGQDSLRVCFYFGGQQQLEHIEIDSTTPNSLLTWQIRQRELQEEITMLQAALDANQAIGGNTMTDAEGQRYQEMLAERTASLLIADGQIKALAK